jgi:hypothetical protein
MTTIHNNRSEARQDAHDVLTDLRETLEGVINNPATSASDRGAAMTELNELNSRWENLLDRSRTASTYERVENDMRDRLYDLRSAGHGGAADCGESFFTLPGDGALLDRFPALAPRTADYTDGESMAKLLDSNPEAFKAWWGELSAEERDIGMMQMQEHMQQRSQMQTMITNMLSAQHDSVMAIARNLAV